MCKSRVAHAGALLMSMASYVPRACICGIGDTDTLYISNLPLRCGAMELRRIFEEVGEVQDCRIVNNPVSR